MPNKRSGKRNMIPYENLFDFGLDRREQKKIWRECYLKTNGKSHTFLVKLPKTCHIKFHILFHCCLSTQHTESSWTWRKTNQKHEWWLWQEKKISQWVVVAWKLNKNKWKKKTNDFFRHEIVIGGTSSNPKRRFSFVYSVFYVILF